MTKLKFIYLLLNISIMIYIAFHIFDFSIFHIAWADTPNDSIHSIEPQNNVSVSEDNTLDNGVQEKLSFYQSFRCRFYWRFIEKKRSNYGSYKEFKSHWNPKTKVWKATFVEWLDDSKDAEKLHQFEDAARATYKRKQMEHRYRLKQYKDLYNDRDRYRK